MKFALIDASNLVHRAKHAIKATPRSPVEIDDEDDAYTMDERVGLVLDIVFSAIRKASQKFGADHLVVAFDSYSWRRDYYPEYKAQRREAQEAEKKRREAAGITMPDDNAIIKRVIADLKEFLVDGTNVTVLEAKGIEADDFIGRWVQIHDHEVFEHVIISADGDFKQLVRPGVDLFDPIYNRLFTIDGVFYQDGKRSSASVPTLTRYGEIWKVKLDKQGEPEKFDPAWELFKKCIRGDASDNIRQAYPRVPEKRMRAAFEDRGGVLWNNLINESWQAGEERRSVREAYERNRRLIDLTHQPDEIKARIDAAIEKTLSKGRKMLVGVHFARFCQRFRLTRLGTQANTISQILATPYQGD